MIPSILYVLVLHLWNVCVCVDTYMHAYTQFQGCWLKGEVYGVQDVWSFY